MIGPFDKHAHFGRGALFRIEHANFVVEQLGGADLRIARRECLAQGRVERVDRAIALRGGVHDLVTDLHLDGRLADQLTPFTLLLPVFSTILAVLLLRETLTVRLAAGGGLVLLGVALIIIRRVPVPPMKAEII